MESCLLSGYNKDKEKDERKLEELVENQPDDKGNKLTIYCLAVTFTTQQINS